MDFLYKLVFEKSGLANASFLNGARTYFMIAGGVLALLAPQVADLVVQAPAMDNFEFTMAIVKMAGTVVAGFATAGFKRAGVEKAKTA
jgi:hypothetical protein